MRPSTRAILIATFAFFVMAMCVKAVPRIPVHEVVFFRSFVTLILSWGWFRWKGLSPWGSGNPSLYVRGCFGLCSMMFYFIALHHLPLAVAVTVQYMHPIFTMILAVLFLKEGATKSQWLGCLIAFVGVTLLREWAGVGQGLYVGAALASAAFSAGSYTMIRVLRKSDPPMVVVFYFFLVSVPISGLLCLWEWVKPTWHETVLLISAGIATQFGQLFLTHALHEDPASRSAVWNYLGAIYATFAGWLLFGEMISLSGFFGMVLIFMGVVIGAHSDLFQKRRELIR